MGWWSEDIIGGDIPLDVIYEIYNACGKEEFDDNGDEVELTKEDINSNIDKILKLKSGYDGDDENIFYQVLGYMIMERGATLSNDLKQKIINACENDEYATESSKRLEIIKNFIDTVKLYNGISVQIINGIGHDRKPKAIIKPITIDTDDNMSMASQTKFSVNILNRIEINHIKQHGADETIQIFPDDIDKVIEFLQSAKEKINK